MQLRTAVSIPALQTLTDNDRLLLIGSCFASQMSPRFAAVKIPLLQNPYGITYNPLTIFSQLHDLYTHNRPTCTQLDGQAYPFQHHGSFRKGTSEETMQVVTQSWEAAVSWMADCSQLILTFGTAHCWLREGQVVNNCHRRPNHEFTRQLLSVQDIVTAFQELVPHIPPHVRITLTLSPVRYVRDGLLDSSLSKAILRTAIHEICQAHGCVQYFPAYEIMMDELRDYRFYKADMLHPSGVAEEYIWQIIGQHLLDEKLRHREQALQKLYKRLAHRPRHPEGPEHASFKLKTGQLLAQLMRQYPALDWSQEQRQIG